MSATIPNLTDLIKQLRHKTGVGIMSCKKALIEAEGDLEKAYDLLRARGEKMAAGKAERSALEGRVAIVKGDHDIAMATVNCETDFVSKGEDFQSFANSVAQVAYGEKINDLQELMAKPLAAGTVESERVALVSKIGENIQVSQVCYHSDDEGYVYVYNHGEKLACAVFLSENNEAVARDIGMHIVAMNPLAVTPEEVPADSLAREKALFEQQTAQMGKNPEMSAKIVDGKIAKYLKEVCLLDQSFVKDTTMTVSQYLKQSNARVLKFIRVELG